MTVRDPVPCRLCGAEPIVKQGPSGIVSLSCEACTSDDPKHARFSHFGAGTSLDRAISAWDWAMRQGAKQAEGA